MKKMLSAMACLLPVVLVLGCPTPPGGSRTTSSWQVVGSAGFSAGSAINLSLAIDPSGTPYVAYEDGANINKATVMKYANGSWGVVGTADFSAGAAPCLSLAIDPSGTPYVRLSGHSKRF